MPRLMAMRDVSGFATAARRLARTGTAIVVLAASTTSASAYRWLAPPVMDETEPPVAHRPGPVAPTAALPTATSPAAAPITAASPTAAPPTAAPPTASSAAAARASNDPPDLIQGGTALATGVAWATYYTAAALLSQSRAGALALAGAIGQIVWEASYAVGVNRTPALNPPVADPTPNPSVTNRPAEVVPAALPPVPEPAPPVVAVSADQDPGLLAHFIYDHAARQPDGRVFVPKPLQRLFGLRTQRAVTGEVPVVLTLAGRIIPDPHAHGHVEAGLAGRITAPAAGLPVLGDRVTKDQVLALVTPVVELVDRTQTLREVVRLTTEIRIEAESQERLKQFAFVPFRDGKIYQSQAHLDGLRRERAALLPMLDTQEVLRAPVAGVISRSLAVEGGVVRPGEIIFEIVDPDRLWIEAMAPDPVTAQDVDAIVAASARTPEGQMLRLSFVGSGLALRQQATPMLFRIHTPPSGLRLDRPVTVAVQGRRTERGIPVPRDAVTMAVDGIQEVWEQVAPEFFAAHPVQTHDLDGERLLIVGGLTEGARVVAGGARLMAQLQ